MPEVIAAIEANWLGSKELAYTMIRRAKEAGADRVKMQMYRADQVQNHPKFAETLLESKLTPELARDFKEYSDSIGIEWHCTPMYLEAVDILEEIGVKAYKIREKDSENRKLIDKVLATGKPVFISSQKLSIDQYLLYNPQIKWLFCKPEYPMSDEALKELATVDFRVWFGYSNHSPSFYAPIFALSRGARAVEVHVTTEKARRCPDQAVSVTFGDLCAICQYRDFIEKIGLGTEYLDIL